MAEAAQTTRSWVRRLPLPTLLAMSVGLVLVTAVLINNQWDPLAFVTYDGHFAYQIALRPASAAPFLDVPAYRYQRILYPLISRVLALGMPDLVPWTLILTNILAIGMGTWTVEQLLAESCVSRWYAIAYGLYGGQLVALRTNLTEPLAYGLVALATLLWMRERLGWAVICFALAGLTKEVTLIFPVAFVIYSLIQRQWRQGIIVALSALPFFAFQLGLWAWLGIPGLGSGGAGATPFSWIPLGGWLTIANVSWVAFGLVSLMVVPMAVVPTLAGLWLSSRRLLSGHHHPWIYTLFLNGLMILILPNSTFREGAAMIRLMYGVMLSLLLYGALVRSKRVLNYSLLWIFSNVLLVKGVA